MSLFLQSPPHPLNPVVRLAFIQQGLKPLTHDVHNTRAGQASICVKPLSSERKCSGSFCLWQRSSAIVRVRVPVHTAERDNRPGPYLDISVEHVTRFLHLVGGGVLPHTQSLPMYMCKDSQSGTGEQQVMALYIFKETYLHHTCGNKTSPDL